jgi:hypothetical protein
MKNYEMITVKAYVDNYEVKYTSVSEYEIEKQVEKYLLSTKRNETNAKVIEALLA